MILLIANEKANWGSGRWKVRQVTGFLEGKGLRTSVSATQYPGHARVGRHGGGAGNRHGPRPRG